MDATGVKSPVVGFEKNCKNAELVSKLSLAGHNSGSAYVTALRNSVSADTGVDLAVWTICGQFELNIRGSESLPAGLLAPSKRILSRTSASQFFQETEGAGAGQPIASGAGDDPTAHGARVEAATAAAA